MGRIGSVHLITFFFLHLRLVFRTNPILRLVIHLPKCRSFLALLSWFWLFPSFLPTGMIVARTDSGAFSPSTWRGMR